MLGIKCDKDIKNGINLHIAINKRRLIHKLQLCTKSALIHCDLNRLDDTQFDGILVYK